MAPKLIQCIKFSFSLTAGARFRWINNKSVPHSSSVFACRRGKNTCAPSIVYRLLIGWNCHTTWSQRNLHYMRFWSSIENFSACSRVLRGSILLPPRHPSTFARMARWQSVECVRFKLIVKEELALTENAKRTNLAHGSFSMVIQFGHCTCVRARTYSL